MTTGTPDNGVSPTPQAAGGPGSPAQSVPRPPVMVGSSDFVASSVANPLSEIPRPPAGAVRRTMNVDVGPRAAWDAALAMLGRARDVRITGADVRNAGADVRTAGAGEEAEVIDEAAVEAGFDTERKLVSLRCTPDAEWAAELVGACAGGGFRSHLDWVVPDHAARSLLRQVLDDMPAAALISGYGFMRLARRQGLTAADFPAASVELMAKRMTDLCSGWRRGGLALSSLEGGSGIPLQDCPPAPVFDASDWHDMEPLELDWMRRRRLMDLEVQGQTFRATAMFRDSVGEGDGMELVLHEYLVRVRGLLDHRGATLTEVEADPRVLPFPECPSAAESVGDLRGRRLSDLGSSVPEVLKGIRCCTHLNDLLRALAGLSDLVPLLAVR